MNDHETETPENIENDPVELEETGSQEEGSGPGPRNFLIVGAVIVFAALLIGGYFYLERAKTPPAAEEDKPDVTVSVKVAKAEKEPIAKEVTALGTVTAKEQSSVSASLSAQIKQMRLLKNQFVKQGEVLAVLASSDLAAQRSEAQATLEEARLNLQTINRVTVPQTEAQTEKDLADASAAVDNTRATYERRKDLYAKGGISLKEVEASELALKNAENALRLVRQNKKLNSSAVNPNSRAIAESKIKQAEDHVKTIDTQVSLAEVRAPISGIVIDQLQFEGEFASAGAKLVTIANTSEVIVKANFADTVVANLHTNDAVAVYSADAPGERLSGKVTSISRSSDPQNRTVEVWANFGNESGLLRINGTVQMVVSAQPVSDAVTVPQAAVTLDAANSDEGTIMTVDDGSVAHETKVKVGIKNGGKIQILEGLKDGDTVVIEGNYALPDGTKVEIAADEPEGADEKDPGDKKSGDPKDSADEKKTDAKGTGDKKKAQSEEK